MEVDLIFQIAAIGIIVAVLNQLLVRSGREEQAMMTTLAGLVVVLMMVVREIAALCRARGIPSVLEEMVYNLCDNAVKYNHSGGTVAVSVSPKGKGGVVEVTDTGIGIPIQDQQRVFERFYRVDKSHSKEIGGTGLGLSIVKHGALLHNAQIYLNSQVDRGTSIRISFPK